MGKLPGSTGYNKLQWAAKIIVGYTRLLYVGHIHQSTYHVVMPDYTGLHKAVQGNMQHATQELHKTES